MKMTDAPLYAQVIIDITSRDLDRTFLYRVGDELRSLVEPGTVVEVPFGKGSRRVRAYVLELTHDTDLPQEKIKEIAAVVTDAQGEESRLIALASWMRERYGCTMAQALRTVIPGRQRVAARKRTILQLDLSREDAERTLEVYEKKHQKARARLLRALMEQPVLPKDLVSEKLRITSDVIRALTEQGVITTRTQKVWRMPDMPAEREDQALVLTTAQQSVVDDIIHGWEHGSDPGSYLLHGVTGSGKTAVYMALIAHALARGEQVILLIPEISLTYQTLMRLYGRFGSRVSVINSRLSAGERYDQFELAAAGQISVMIGPRSALFTPFPHLGLIVIDEEHDGAYISESTPGYNAIETARKRASIEGACLVLGSATPSLTSYYAALQGQMKLLTLPERISGSLPQTQIVDMRQELREGCRSPLSRQLQSALADVLERREQAMLFLNRRGYASSVACRSCGEAVRCPHCDVSLSLHNNGRMICHYCGYERGAVKVCPSCGSGFIRAFRAGTQQIEQEVQRLFPSARILRMDADTTKKKESHNRLLSAFADHDADILIGTQMIVKGHDFPEVTLMGILAADLSLNAESYKAGERTYQLITQAVGRAGRAQRPGLAVIQTYQPDHYAIQCGAAQNYQTFYEQEISYRQMGMYPPAGALTAVHLSGADQEQTEKAAYFLGKFVEHYASRAGIQVLGPADETVARIQDQYRKVLYLKALDDALLVPVRDLMLRYIGMNEGFRHIRIKLEVE